MRKQRVNAHLCFRVAENDLRSAVFMRDYVGALNFHCFQRIPGFPLGHSVPDGEIITRVQNGQEYNNSESHAMHHGDETIHFPRLMISPGVISPGSMMMLPPMGSAPET